VRQSFCCIQSFLKSPILLIFQIFICHLFLFNKSPNAKELGIEYPQKSIQSKKVSTIIKEISALINKSNSKFNKPYD
jgi:hypothetical protein